MLPSWGNPLKRRGLTAPPKAAKRAQAQSTNLWPYSFFLTLLTTAFLSLTACTTTSLTVDSFPASPDRLAESYQASGEKGMVATAHPLASQAGLEMLQAGGNAIDATVAASFVISVVRPQSTGIGGGGFLLYYNHSAQDTAVYDFRERAPIQATQDMFLDAEQNPRDFLYEGVRIPEASVNGHLAVGTPGLVAGLVEVHRQHGTLPLPQVMAPAIKAAREGFPVYPSLTLAIYERMAILNNFKASRDIFLPQGKPLEPGEKLLQSDLAHTLELIAEKGHDGFYKGEVAEKIIAEMQKGGILTQADLDSYTVKKANPVVGNYRGYKIVSMPPPSSGGLHIIQILNMLTDDPISELGRQSTAYNHLLAEAMRRAYADRAKYLGDPAFVKVPITGLLNPAYAAALRQTIDRHQATPSRSLAPGDPLPYESPSTTHISVVDPWGNAVSSTQTINYVFGSGVVAAGTGIVLNDEMDDFAIKPGQPNAYGLVGSEANAVAARKTMLSSMSPSLIFDPAGQLRLIVGAPGGSFIITATLQTIINTIDFKMPLAQAVHAYRIHHQWLPDTLVMESENALPESTKTQLKRLGHELSIGGPLGDVQAIARENDRWVGVSDTRSDGQPLGF